MDSHGIARRKDTLTSTADGREQTSSREIDTNRENNPFQILSSRLYRTQIVAAVGSNTASTAGIDPSNCQQNCQQTALKKVTRVVEELA
jgi:hypothetical protein